MKVLKCFMTLLLGALVLVSCKEKEPENKVYTIEVDRTAITDVAANNPGVEALVITTDAPYWLLTAPDWVTPDTKQGVGGGKSTIVSLTIASNYKNEATTTYARSGEIKISGGNTSVTVPINQLGHTAVVDPNASIGGIPDLKEFLDFVNAVNEGEAPVRWMNAKMEIELLADIDLASVTEWKPIGDAFTTNGNYASGVKGESGNAFTGVFNGGNHTIKNFKYSATLDDQQTWGLFGFIDHATIKNLNVEADVAISATGSADAGVVVGTAISSTIENVKLTGKITSAGSSAAKRFAIGGIAGFVFCEYNAAEGTAYESFIQNCEVNMDVNIDCGINTAAGATGVMYGGIAGFATKADEDTPSFNHILNCVNNGTMTMKTGRCSGIVPTCNRATIVEKCVNNASQVNTIENGRIGQIVCNLSKYSAVIDCINNGDLTTMDAQTTTAALVALIGDDTAYITGGEKPCNTATIIGGNTSYLGLIAANISKCDHVSDLLVSGRLGVYKENGNHEMYAVNNSNIMEYIGTINSNYKDKVTNITYVKLNPDDPDPEVPSTGGNIGDLDPVNDQWN
ncbi:MAG: hypothetical protein IKX67_04205 [Bacteroidales bacterium]|nr:hypothetical protein [Bacteroidales bacterium]